MLSEPFHRLIVNDEEDEVREARPLGSTAPERHAQITNDAEMKTVAEEDENEPRLQGRRSRSGFHV